jgi:hypothetical protein
MLVMVYISSHSTPTTAPAYLEIMLMINDFGKIATEEWFRSFEMRDELFLDEFILMPNHLHAIVGL